MIFSAARLGGALALVLAVVPAWAGVQISMTADRARIGLEDKVRVSIAVTDAPAMTEVRFPEAVDFDLLSREQAGWMEARRAGRATADDEAVTYTLVLRAKRTGKLVIPPAEVLTPRETITTLPLTVEVVQGRLEPAEPVTQTRRRFPFDWTPPRMGSPSDDDGDPFGALIAPGHPTNDPDMFVRATLDKAEVYQGEQVVMSLLLYTTREFSVLERVRLPKFEGFWTRDIATSDRLVSDRRASDGGLFNVYVLRRVLLFPVHAGDLTIPSCEVSVDLRREGSREVLRPKSDPLTLAVKPLPPGGTSTLVGQWSLATTLPQAAVGLGDTVQLTVVLRGRGALEGAQLPHVAWPATVRVLSERARDDSALLHGVLNSTRTVDYVVAPETAGTFTLAGLSLPYFNPQTGKHEEAKTEPVVITVGPRAEGRPAIAAPVQVATQPAGPEQGTRPAGERPDEPAEPAPTAAPPLGRPYSVVIIAAVLLTLALAAGGLARVARGRKAGTSAAQGRLAAAAKLVTGGSASDFYGEVELAMKTFLAAKLGESVTGLTRDQVDDLLARHQVAQEERARLLAIFETCDLGRYAPGVGEASARQRVLGDAVAAMKAWP